MTQHATELNDVDTALVKLAEWRGHVPRLLARLRPFMRLEPGDPMLDIGAAQGVTVTAFLEHGFAARGVEPSADALATRHQLSQRTGVETDIVKGIAEDLPFADGEFQYVHLYSVLEHVDDPWAVFREALRVLRPGGGLFFSTTAHISPRQSEIVRFPGFPWYPDRVRRGIMDWAMREKPWLVGHTTRPAYWWFDHRDVQRRLHETGFGRVVDMWEMRAAAQESEGMRKRVVDAAATIAPVRVAANMALGGMEYLAVK